MDGDVGVIGDRVVECSEANMLLKLRDMHLRVEQMGENTVLSVLPMVRGIGVYSVELCQGGARVVCRKTSVTV